MEQIAGLISTSLLNFDSMNFDWLKDLGGKTAVSDFKPRSAWSRWGVLEIVNFARRELLMCILHYGLGRGQVGAILCNRAPPLFPPVCHAPKSGVALFGLFSGVSPQR